jgi:hypothetical protein
VFKIALYGTCCVSFPVTFLTTDMQQGATILSSKSEINSIEYLCTQQLTDICISVTEGANVLTDGCLKAADEAPEDNLREQFRLCLKSVTAAVNAFCGSIKFLKDKPTETNYRACQVLHSVHINVHIYRCSCSRQKVEWI